MDDRHYQALAKAIGPRIAERYFGRRYLVQFRHNPKPGLHEFWEDVGSHDSLPEAVQDAFKTGRWAGSTGGLVRVLDMLGAPEAGCDKWRATTHETKHEVFRSPYWNHYFEYGAICHRGERV